MNTTPRPGRRVLPWLALGLVALVAIALRWLVIQSPTVGNVCLAQPQLTGCVLRQQLVLGFLDYAYGYTALAAAALALLWRRGATAWLAAAVGVFAFTLYCEQAGALAMLLGGVLLLPPGAPGTHQHRQRDRQVQSEP